MAKRLASQLLLAIVGLTVSSGMLYAQTSYRTPDPNGIAYQIPNTTVTVSVDEFGNCKRVVNNSSNALFIPTKTSSEYQSFLDHPPTNVTINACLPSRPGPIALCGNNPGATYNPNGASITLWSNYQSSCTSAGGVPTATFNGTVGCGPPPNPDSKYDWTGHCN